MNYGIPYRGSKSRIAAWIVEHLPAADCLYDLFAGGCAVTHAAWLSGKFKRIVANDIKGQYPQCFLDASAGLYKDERRVIDREEFQRLKAKDPYVASCWSFGNNLRSYLWSGENCDLKIKACKMIMADTWKERERLFVDFIKELRKGMPTRMDLKRLERLQSLERLERLQSIERLERLQSIEVSCASYEDVDIAPHSTVYCDIPYKGTELYGAPFDYDKFYEWCLTREYPVIISEYNMPDCFAPIAETGKACTMCATGKAKRAVERLYVQRRFAGQFN